MNQIELKRQKDRERSKRYRERHKDRERDRKAEKRACLKGRCDLLYENALGRAKKRGLEFTLTREFIRQLFEEQECKCSLTGISFDYARPTVGTFNPYSPSLDRIDNCKGYTPDNVRLVLTCVNLAFNQFGKDIFDQWIKHYKG